MKRTQNRAPRWSRRVAWLLLVGAAACGPKATPLTELTPEDLWTRGVAAYNEEEWEDALRYFNRFVLTGGTDPRVHQARYYVGQAHFSRGDYLTAAAEFSRLSGDLGRADLSDDARFMACRSYEELAPGPQLDQEYTRAAMDHCRALLDYFPDSEYSERAAAIIERMRSRLAEKAFQTGDWYQGRRAFDSAIIYFEDVADNYAETDWAPRALSRLIQIYGILEWEDERAEVRERLLREYPDAAEARALSGG